MIPHMRTFVENSRYSGTRVSSKFNRKMEMKLRGAESRTRCLPERKVIQTTVFIGEGVYPKDILPFTLCNMVISFLILCCMEVENTQ